MLSGDSGELGSDVKWWRVASAQMDRFVLIIRCPAVNLSARALPLDLEATGS